MYIHSTYKYVKYMYVYVLEIDIYNMYIIKPFIRKYSFSILIIIMIDVCFHFMDGSTFKYLSLLLAN